MPKTATVPQIEFRLLPNDHIKFDDVCRVKGKKRSEVAREAIVWYLENQEKLSAEIRESALEKRIRKMEERMASLMARTAIDVGMVFHILYRNMDKEKREDIIAWAYNSAVARLKKKLEGQAAEVREQMQKLDDKDSSKTQLRKR